MAGRRLEVRWRFAMDGYAELEFMPPSSEPTSVDATLNRLARRAAALPPVAPAQPPELISFGSGEASPAVLPDMTQAAEIALTRYRSETLQYAPPMGLPALREWLCGYLLEDGVSASVDEVIVINGAKHGLDLVCRALLDEGDSVVVTAPTYFTGLPILRSHGAEFVEVAQDAEGLDVEELRTVLAAIEREGHPLPKFIYDVPDFHNPTGITMTRRRREAVVELAATQGIFFVEDSPYRHIRFEGRDEPSLKSLDREGWVISLGSFAKLLAPGLRVGWVVASSDLVARLAQLKSDGGSCPLTQRMVLEFCGAGHFAAHNERARVAYRQHRDRMVAAITRCFPEISLTVPQGGYYLWLPLPVGVSGDELASAAAREGVFVHAGSEFYANPNRPFPDNHWLPASHVRLAYSFASLEEIDEGVTRLARAYESITA